MSDSAVLVHVPEAERAVGEWRLRHTRDAPVGVPAHVTLLSPFLPVEELTAGIEERLVRIVGAAEPFGVSFLRTARFPGVLYLEPTPPAPFASLSRAIAAAWPERPPYAGVHATVIPHLTVAESTDDDLLAGIATEVEARLPLAIDVREAQLYAEDAAGHWHERRRLPLGR